MFKTTLFLVLTLFFSAFAHDEDSHEQADAQLFYQSLVESHYYTFGKMVSPEQGYVGMENVLNDYNAVAAKLYSRKQNQRLLEEHLEEDHPGTFKQMKKNQMLSASMHKLLNNLLVFVKATSSSREDMANYEAKILAFADSEQELPEGKDPIGQLINMNLFALGRGASFQFDYKEQLKNLNNRLQAQKNNLGPYALAYDYVTSHEYGARMVNDYYSFYAQRWYSDLEQPQWQKFFSLKKDLLTISTKSFREIYGIYRESIEELRRTNPQETKNLPQIDDAQWEQNLKRWEALEKDPEAAKMAKNSMVLPTMMPIFKDRVVRSKSYEELKEYSKKYQGTGDILATLKIEDEVYGLK